MCQQKQKLVDLQTEVVIVSFGTLPAVQEWLRETCGSFEVVLDSDRAVYKAYGLERSYWRSRTLMTRWDYFKAWLAGMQTHASHEEDTSQLGGDFIVGKDGKLYLVHPSHDPTDRPNVESLFDLLQKLQRQENE